MLNRIFPDFAKLEQVRWESSFKRSQHGY